jgi:hypothetical protein
MSPHGSVVKFSSVALATRSSKALGCDRNIAMMDVLESGYQEQKTTIQTIPRLHSTTNPKRLEEIDAES